MSVLYDGGDQEGSAAMGGSLLKYGPNSGVRLSPWVRIGTTNLYIRQMGYLVQVQGSYTKVGSGAGWFGIPSQFGKPYADFMVAQLTDCSGNRTQRGFKYLVRTSGNVTMLNEYGADTTLGISFCYMATSLYTG